MIHCADKTKVMAQINEGFAQMTPERMWTMVADAGFRIVQEDTTTMWHSLLVRFAH